MRSLAVLLTNNTLNRRAGSELYVYDVARALLRRGHRPVAFSTVLGPVAEALRQAGVPVTSDLESIQDPPDIIHGHHHLETLMAVLHFPSVAAINFCHGWAPPEEAPLRHPSIRRYVAVDDKCRSRLMDLEGIDPNLVEVLLNFVDVDRFLPRAPLPERPLRALVFSNLADQHTYVGSIRRACAHFGISVDVAGLRSGNVVEAPEAMLGQYDIVFAKARAALEALAVGCAVILADQHGGGPLVTTDNMHGLRRLNFGFSTLTHAHEEDAYRAEIARFTAGDAARVSWWVRSDAALEPAVDRLLAIYGEAMTLPCQPGDPGRAAARHLRRVRESLTAASDAFTQSEIAVAALLAARETGARTVADLRQALAEQLRLREVTDGDGT